MIIKIMGGIDLVASIILFFNGVMPEKLLGYVASYLIGKGVLFGMSGDIASYIDAGIGVYAIFLSFGLSSTILSTLATIYLLQKAVISFF
ncbi:MAG TPA: hypothetical protein VJC16_04095 [Candidatus Nanoarchaeia archaeon]|nr:hypothetical protein [Candidatus Nanoarchaeia archaeon]